MKNRKLFFFIFILLAAWLLLSNVLIGHLWNKMNNSIPRKVDFSEFSSNSSFMIEAEIDYCYVQNGMLEILSINGWAYNSELPAPEDNIEKEIAILLKSSKQCYLIPGSTYLRHDTRQPDGFGTEVSLLEIPDEIYRIYILCFEGNGNYGISATSCLINVENGNIVLCDYPSKQIEIDDSKAVTEPNMQYSPGITVSSDKIDLWGWACISDKSSETQEVIISFCDQENNKYFYSTAPVERYNLVDHLGSEKYLMSGFQTTISGENLDQCDWTVRIYIKQDNELYRAPKLFAYDAESKEISWISANDFQPTLLDIDLTAIVTENNMRYDPGITVTSTQINFWGWTFIQECDSSTQQVAILFTDDDEEAQIYSTLPIERQGIAKLYGSEEYLLSGFQSFIQGENFDSSDWTIRILIKQNDQWYQSPHLFIHDGRTDQITWVERPNG